jgi:hypothetical protein
MLINLLIFSSSSTILFFDLLFIRSNLFESLLGSLLSNIISRGCFQLTVQFLKSLSTRPFFLSGPSFGNWVKKFIEFFLFRVIADVRVNKSIIFKFFCCLFLFFFIAFIFFYIFFFLFLQLLMIMLELADLVCDFSKKVLEFIDLKNPHPLFHPLLPCVKH